MRCCVCAAEKQVEEIFISDKREIVCKKCEAFYNEYHFNTFSFENGQVIAHSPMENKSDLEQRGIVIDYIHVLFNGKVSNVAYVQLKSMLQKYTWLEILQGLEYFFKIKKESISKANGKIGIIPYIIETSNAFYKRENERRMNLYRKQISVQQKQDVEIVSYTKETKKDKIDMRDL